MGLGVREMARQLGCAASLVSRYKGQGMPLDSAAAARAWMDENVRRDIRTAFRRDRLDDAADDYQSARVRRERAEAELAELRLAELQGQLVRADDWAAALAKRAAAFREGLLQIPARLSAQLAAESDQARIHTLLEDELRQVMEQLTQA